MRSHRNSKARLTARERATYAAQRIFDMWPSPGISFEATERIIQRAIAAAVRTALARNDRRARKGR